MSHPHPELASPPELATDGLRIIALGGLGEIGRNMAVLEHRGRLLVIDCGVLFPDETQPGVDLILPDFEAIRHRLGDIEALVLTHGHEDHIGAVPYLLRDRPDIPLVGSKLTLAVLEGKLREHRQTRAPKHEVKEGDRVAFGPFGLEFIAVNHSIPDALAVAVRTSAGVVLHTGDFKMDQLPLDGRITDLRAFARLGARVWTCSWWTRPTRRSPASPRRRERSVPCSARCSRAAPSASSSRVSRLMCIGSNR